MRCWWNTDFTYANPIEEIQLSEHVRHWDDHVGNRPIEAIFCGFHSKCFWSAKSDCAWFAFSNTRFLKVDGLQHSNDHDNTVDFYVFNKLMIICADSCLHEVMARYIHWIATCFKIKVNLRMDISWSLPRSKQFAQRTTQFCPVFRQILQVNNWPQ